MISRDEMDQLGEKEVRVIKLGLEDLAKLFPKATAKEILKAMGSQRDLEKAKTLLQDLERSGMLKHQRNPHLGGFAPAEGRAWNPLRDYPRNLPCFCGSKKKFKKCCLAKMGDTVKAEDAAKLKKFLGRKVPAMEAKRGR